MFFTFVLAVLLVGEPDQTGSGLTWSRVSGIPPDQKALSVIVGFQHRPDHLRQPPPLPHPSSPTRSHACVYKIPVKLNFFLPPAASPLFFKTVCRLFLAS